MGRKKTYDRDELLAKAVDVFRTHGFAGSSAELLVQQLGVSRFGLYAEFGSKQGLFEAALERYDDEVVGRRFGPLEAAGAGLAEIRALFAFYGAATEGPAAGRGCLLCNSVVEFGPLDPSDAQFLRRYLERIRDAFRTALAAASARGEVRSDVDVQAEAHFFTATVLGLFVLLRADAPAESVVDATHVAIAHLDALRA